MFRKKDEELPVSEPVLAPEETAYEDNWYRSLKALAERQEDDAEDEASVESSAQDEVPVDALPAGAPDDGAPLEAAVEEPARSGEPAHEQEQDDSLPPELEVRAGQLLERLRSLQHLGDVPAPEPEPETPSVWS